MGRIFRRLKKVFITGLLSINCILLGGCAESPYQNASSQFYRIKSQNLNWDFKETFKNLPIIISNALKDYVVSITMVSLILGALILKLIPHEPAIRKRVIIVFCLVIPGVVWILTYGTAAWASILN